MFDLSTVEILLILLRLTLICAGSYFLTDLLANWFFDRKKVRAAKKLASERAEFEKRLAQAGVPDKRSLSYMEAELGMLSARVTQLIQSDKHKSEVGKAGNDQNSHSFHLPSGSTYSVYSSMPLSFGPASPTKNKPKKKTK